MSTIELLNEAGTSTLSDARFVVATSGQYTGTSFTVARTTAHA